MQNVDLLIYPPFNGIESVIDGVKHNYKIRFVGVRRKGKIR
jgi:hypothetical protein